MELFPYLRDIVVLFGVALAVIAASQTLRIPTVVGFLLTGCVVGPYGAGLIHNPEHVEIFAELGIIFILFEIGLELSFKRLKKLGRVFFTGGTLQAASTIALTTGIACLCGYALRSSLFFGLMLSLSSTAIVLKLYADRRGLDTPHGNISLGILLFQDFLIVPFLLIVPLLAGSSSVSPTHVLIRFGGGLAVIGVVVAGSRYIIPRGLRFLASTRIRELFVIGSLFLCLGAALATEQLGFSLALGALLAGILIAESDYYHQVMAETTPFRDVFNSMFFISIGMLLKFDFASKHLGAILLVTAAIMIIKSAALVFSAKLLSFPLRVSFQTALGLCQIGEFSFVLIRSGKMYNVIDEPTYQLAIAASILTMALTPLLIAIAPRIAGVLPSSSERKNHGQRLSGHVIIVGFGLAGRHLAGVLKTAMIPYIVVELNGAAVEKAKKTGEPILYGDATRQIILEQVCMQEAQVVVFVISDSLAVRRGVCLARQMNPNVSIIVRTRMQSDIEELRRCGATEVVSEEFETSIEIFTNVLTKLHIPGNIIKSQTRLLRDNGYSMLRSPAAVNRFSERIAQVLSMGTTDTFLITSDLTAVGKTIADLHVRKHTGATIIAVVRDEKPMTNPAPDLILNAGDLLVLVGNHAQMDAAFLFLEKLKDGAILPQKNHSEEI
ncbi:MAG: hypothetical protein A2487_18730 [Candidatus Raymondbacteria bacterium RifOxyC12_full_50_8]|nr:MAG: hypothetical protein A2487_18730 [Candidatus Raymondbacteria bacterium RifOxyC12_full_50_8]